MLLRALRAVLPDWALLFTGNLLMSTGLAGSACRFYETFLARQPEHEGARLLYANSLRDAGHHAGAMRAYGELTATASANSRVYIELGQLHLMRDEADEAVSCFREAYNRGNREEAISWLARWGFSQDANDMGGETPEPRQAEWFFDITDVLLYLETHATVSGIQRVVTNLFVVLDTAQERREGKQRRFCWLDPSCGSLREVPAERFRQVLAELEQGVTTGLALARAVSSCRNGDVIRFGAGDILVILGAFWISPAYFRTLFALRGQDVRIGVFIYDLLPVSNPEFFEPDLVEVFARSLPEVLLLSDFALTISAYTREQVISFARKALNRELTVRAVPLAHELKSFGSREKISRDVLDICQTRFALCVGTIEVRKNHRLLVSVWADLLRERGAENVPDLVIVGRWGWKVEELRRELERVGFLSGKVVILSGVSDAGLSELYRHAAFTVFPSLAEGWGLPIGESLAHGTPCIASDATAMPEVGGGFVNYVDPRSRESLRQAIAAMVDDPQRLSDAAAHIRAQFRARSWYDFSRDFEAALNAVSGGHQRHDTYAALELGRVYVDDAEPAGVHGKRGEGRGALALALVRGWGSAEGFPGWATSRTPVIRFFVAEMPEMARLRVAICLELPSIQKPVPVRVTSGGCSTLLHVGGSGKRWYFADAEVGSAGRVEFLFEVAGPVFQVEERLARYIKCTGICAADASLPLDRVKMLEALFQSS